MRRLMLNQLSHRAVTFISCLIAFCLQTSIFACRLMRSINTNVWNDAMCSSTLVITTMFTRSSVIFINNNVWKLNSDLHICYSCKLNRDLYLYFALRFALCSIFRLFSFLIYSRMGLHPMYWTRSVVKRFELTISYTFLSLLVVFPKRRKYFEFIVNSQLYGL